MSCVLWCCWPSAKELLKLINIWQRYKSIDWEFEFYEYKNLLIHEFFLRILVKCEYSKFRIESNSYLLFDSIQNWRNYSKFSNTYLTVIRRAIDTPFVVLCQLQAAAFTWRWIQCCAACVHTPPTPLTTHGSLRQLPCVCACSQHQSPMT